MAQLVRNTAAVYCGRFWKRHYKVAFANWPPEGPIAGVWVDMREIAQLHSEQPNATYIPPTLATEDGNLWLGVNSLFLSPRSWTTADGVALLAAPSVQFRIPRDRRTICRQMEHGVFKSFGEEFAHRVMTAIGSVIGSATYREAVENQTELGEKCRRALKEACEEAPDGTNGGLGVVVTSLSLHVHIRSESEAAETTVAVLDYPNEFRRLYDAFEEKGVPGRIGDKAAILTLLALLHQRGEIEKVRSAPQGSLVMISPSAPDRPGSAHPDYQQIIALLARLASEQFEIGGDAPTGAPLIEDGDGGAGDEPGADA